MPSVHVCLTPSGLRVALTHLLLLGTLLLPGIGQAQTQEPAVTFDDDISPQIFQPFCIPCHSSQLVGAMARGSAPAGIDYDTFAFATQGANEERAVVRVLDENNPMPPANFFPPTGVLPQELQDLMVAWQAAGFPENQDDVTPTGMLTASAGVDGDFNVPELTRVTLDGTDSRAADGGPPNTFLWLQTAGPPVLLTNPQSAAPSFVAPDVDTMTSLQFQLSVIDSGDTATATVIVNVFDVAQPFSAEDQTVSGGCALHPGAGFDPVLLGLMGLMLAFLGRRRIRRKWHMGHRVRSLLAGALVSVWFLSLPGPAWGRDLADLIPGLYGGDGITLATTGGSIEHAPHFSILSSNSINLLNAQIGSEISVFPFSSPGGGFTFSFDPSSGTFVRTTESLGPLFADRAPTLGRGKFNLQFSYTFYSYKTFEGDDLDSLEVIIRHDPDTIGPQQGGSDTTREDFELDVIRLLFDIDIRVKLFAVAATYGITDRLDIGILVPLVHVNMDVAARGEIVESPSNTESGIHTFEGAPEGMDDSASDSAFGLGDIVLRAKYHFLDGAVSDIAGALLLKLPTGDKDNFLGTGDTTLRPFFIFSKTFLGTFTPHLNIGYEFNLDNDRQSSLEYAAGFDLGLFKGFTVLGDILGSHEFDGDGIGDHLVNASVGVRWNLLGRFVVAANIQFPVNDDGLRAKLIPTLAAEYSF